MGLPCPGPGWLEDEWDRGTLYLSWLGGWSGCGIGGTVSWSWLGDSMGVGQGVLCPHPS